MHLQAQEETQENDSLMEQQTDITDIARRILKKPPKQESAEKASVAILPILGYNPSFGFNVGINIVAGKQFGLRSNTIYSVFNLSFSYSTKQVVPLRARHNMFTPENKWNWQGDWQISKMGIVDYGLGTGQRTAVEDGFSLFGTPVDNSDSAFPIKHNYIKLLEKAYRKVGKYWYVGGGVSFDMYSKINDEKLKDNRYTPQMVYSKRNEFDSSSYSANGFLLGLYWHPGSVTGNCKTPLYCIEH